MKPTKLIPLSLNLLVFLLFSFNLFAAPGDLDTTFGTGGIVETSNGIIDSDVDIALQADGKIVVLENLSTSTSSTDRDFAFVRYNADGSLDTSFGTAGKVILAETGNQIAGGIAVQSDGKIVAVGSEASNLLVYRLNQNGSLDTTFGTGGKFLPNLGGQSLGRDIVFQPDGKIVIAGQYKAVTGSASIAVFRLNSNGSMDTGFNSTGFYRFIDSNSASSIGNAVALQSDGKIVVAGNYVDSYGIWVRVNSDGTLEGFTGQAILTNVAINDVAIQPDGKILFAGMVRLGFPKTDFALARFNADKTEDKSFGVNGICYVNWGATRQDKAASLIIEPSGNIIVGGNSISGGAVKASIARISAYGVLDFGFGINSKLVTDFNNLSKLIRQPDGKILALGSIDRVQPEKNLIVARYLSGVSGNIPNRPRFDFDGDGKPDVAVFRPSTGYWYILRSSDNGIQSTNWGLATDDPAPADFDGDRKTDIAVRRGTQWYILRSSDNTFMLRNRIGVFATNSTPADFDGDRIDDIGIYFGSGWQVAPTSFDYNNLQIDFLISGAKPFCADFDGDGRADFGIFNPSNATWRIRYSTGIADSVTNFGLATDIPVPADYDGDGKTDIAVFRPSVGDWYWLNSSDGSFSGVHWGATGDKPVPADYDGDGKADIGVFRPADGTWYIYQSTAGFKAVNWGISTDIPIPNVYIR